MSRTLDFKCASYKKWKFALRPRVNGKAICKPSYKSYQLASISDTHAKAQKNESPSCHRQCESETLFQIKSVFDENSISIGSNCSISVCDKPSRSDTPVVQSTPKKIVLKNEMRRRRLSDYFQSIDDYIQASSAASHNGRQKMITDFFRPIPALESEIADNIVELYSEISGDDPRTETRESYNKAEAVRGAAEVARNREELFALIDDISDTPTNVYDESAMSDTANMTRVISAPSSPDSQATV